MKKILLSLFAVSALAYGSFVSVSGGSGGGVTDVTGTSPLSSSGGATPDISIANAAADGSTKGAASFTAADFNSSSGNISIDYANGQAASDSVSGFLTSGSQVIGGLKRVAYSAIDLGASSGWGVAKDGSGNLGFYINAAVGSNQHRWSTSGYTSAINGTDVAWGFVGTGNTVQRLLTLYPNDAVATGAAGSTTLRGGDIAINNSAAGITAGNVILRGGNSSSTTSGIDAGDLSINGGNQTAASGGNSGGDVTVTAGTSVNGSPGSVKIVGAFANTPTAVDLTADDQSLTLTGTSHVRLTSDNTTATNRTFVLGDGNADGQKLILEWNEAVASGAGELADSGNANLSATWTPDIGDTIELTWNSTASEWREISRTDN